MKAWQKIGSALSLGVLLSWSGSSTALAEGNNQPVSIMDNIIMPILLIIERVLSYWVDSVTGNTLSDPLGNRLAAGIATIVQSLVTFFAQFSLLLPSNNI